MSWAQVVQRIDGLMRKGRYISPEEEAERQAIEEAKVDPLEDVYDRFAVIDTEEGEYAIWDNQTDDYYVDPEGVTEYFTDECMMRLSVSMSQTIRTSKSSGNSMICLQQHNKEPVENDWLTSLNKMSIFVLK